MSRSHSLSLTRPDAPPTIETTIRSGPLYRWVVRVTLLVSLMFIICGGASRGEAGPADPDRPIPKSLKKISYTDMNVKASSVARGFSARNLFRMKAWRAWGSDPQEREGAWIKVSWPEIHYLDTIHYVPGDERAPGFFDRECARPAQVRVRADMETREIDLPDIRGHQYITFTPPLVTRSLEFLITEVRGKSNSGGVCLAALSLYAHRKPLLSIKGLKERAETALLQLNEPLKRAEARATLIKIGPAIAPLILQRLQDRKGEEQRYLLEAAPELLTVKDLPSLKRLQPKISHEALDEFLQVRAALGDTDATAQLITRVDQLKPHEQAKILSSVARAHDPTRLQFLLERYGNHPEVDEALREHLPYFKDAYSESLKLYHSARGQRRASILELLAKIDPKLASPLIKRGLAQREDTMIKSGAIRGAAYSLDPTLRSQVRRLVNSVYVIERRAVAFALSQWGDSEDLKRLRELAGDRAMSVRREAISGLGRIGGAEDLLRDYALYGSDESTAESAANAWLSGEARRDVKTPIKLLSSPFESVRARAISALTDHQAAACTPLIKEILRVDPIYIEHVNILRRLWSFCGQSFVDIALESTSAAQRRALSITRELKSPDLNVLVIKLSATTDPETQLSVAQASVVLTREELERSLGSYLESDLITTRCAAMSALAKKQSELTIKVIEQSITSGLDDPYRADRALLLCALDAAGDHSSGRFASLLARAYQSWSKSLGFVSYRLRAIRSLERLPGSPIRLETLLKASTDLDRTVREIALKGLRRK